MTNWIQIMTSLCHLDSDCDFMYYCNKGQCDHEAIFPLSIYSVLVYMLIPIACGLCNMTGNSMGMFKILILMNLLRYDIQNATALIQAVVVGSAIPNFISVVRHHHPNGKTSLVNYNLIYLFIPCCLYGSTIGSLLQNFIPVLLQQVLIVIMFGYFAYKFVKKIRSEYSPQKQQPRDSLITEDNINDSLVKQQVTNSQQKQIISSNVQVSQSLRKPQIKKNKKKKKMSKQKKQFIQYEKSYHLKDILQSFGIFVIFEVLAFTVQGKASFLSFSKCSVQYPLGLLILTGATISYLFYTKNKLFKKFSLYKKYKIEQEINLSSKTQYWRIIIGGFGAGFVQGVLGVGAGTFLMVVMLNFPIDPRSASATSGYQILFTGLGALTQQFINNNISISDGSFFILWSAIGGGFITFLMYHLQKKYEEIKVKRALLLTISFLCFMSLILIFPVSIQRIIQQGWAQVVSIHFKC